MIQVNTRKSQKGNKALRSLCANAPVLGSANAPVPGSADAPVPGSANAPVPGSANAPELGSLRQPAQDRPHLLNSCGREPFEDLAKRGRGAATGASGRGRTARSGACYAGTRAQLQLFYVGKLGALAGKVGGEALEGVQDGTIPGAPGT